MRITAAAALVGARVVSAFSISDYILAAGWTPAHVPAFQASEESTELSSSSGKTINATEPCGVVGERLAASSSGYVDAELAYQCLRSVPLDVEGGLLQLEGLTTMSQFQTTLAYLKDPPSGYLYPAVDILGALDAIKSNLQHGIYASEYDFQMDVYSIISSAHDSHFTYVPDIAHVFGFTRTETLFSLSKDGLSIPEVYLGGTYEHITEYLKSSDSLAPIALINNQNAETWLNYLASQQLYQDPDASYNNLFPVIPLQSQGMPGAFASTINYQGSYTTVTFGDGSTRRIGNLAFTFYDFTNVTDGKSFFEKFCTGKQQTRQQEPETLSQSTKRDLFGNTEAAVPSEPVEALQSLSTSSHYPEPVFSLKDGTVTGYFSEDKPDLAILSVPSFELVTDDMAGFSDTIRTFLTTAHTSNKTKLMIDLRGSNGDYIPLAYDLFTQLFPQISPYGGTNFRATPLVNTIGEIVSAVSHDVSDESAGPANCNNDYNVPLFDYRVTVNEDEQPFSSWQEYFGPQEIHGDNFTSIDRIDVQNSFSTLCAPVSKYRNTASITPQVYQSEDIVIVQDGSCASACAVFTEFAKSQAAVKQIVFGGRPQTGPMQGVGGSKGASVYSLDTLEQSIHNAIYQDATPEQQSSFLDTYSTLLPGLQQALLRAANTTSAGVHARVNVRNNLRRGDAGATPLQFVYEAADCRLFYTRAMVLAQERVWSAAYAARWEGAACVAGSTGQPSAEPDYLDVGGPKSWSSDSSSNNNNNTNTGPLVGAGGSSGNATSWRWPNATITGTAASGRPTPGSNGTGIWSATTAASSWGSTRAPTATGSAAASSGVAPAQGGAAGRASAGLAGTVLVGGVLALAGAAAVLL